MITYPFTETDMQQATDDWGANCGPAALAFACQVHIRDVRGQIPGFEEKRYTSPTMMRAGIANMGRRFTSVDPGKFMTGVNPKWAYTRTHWIASYRKMHEESDSLATAVLGVKSLRGPIDMVFDCNGGVMGFLTWQKEIVPALTAMDKRADGGWYPTHYWRLDP